MSPVELILWVVAGIFFLGGAFRIPLRVDLGWIGAFVVVLAVLASQL
jgi:hypothetical protein